VKKRRKMLSLAASDGMKAEKLKDDGVK